MTYDVFFSKIPLFTAKRAIWLYQLDSSCFFLTVLCTPFILKLCVNFYALACIHWVFSRSISNFVHDLFLFLFFIHDRNTYVDSTIATLSSGYVSVFKYFFKLSHFDATEWFLFLFFLGCQSSQGEIQEFRLFFWEIGWSGRFLRENRSPDSLLVWIWKKNWIIF